MYLKQVKEPLASTKRELDETGRRREDCRMGNDGGEKKKGDLITAQERTKKSTIFTVL